MTALADTNPLREALERIVSESTQWRWTKKDTADTALAKIAVQMREVARAALASEPVAGTVREAMPAWVDTRVVRFDDAIVFGHGGFDFDRWDGMREELHTEAGSFAVWRSGNKSWSLYGGKIGILALDRYSSEQEAKAEVELIAGVHRKPEQTFEYWHQRALKAEAALSAPPAPAAEDIGREAEELIANSRPAPTGREDPRALIDERLVDLRKANDVFFEMGWDKSSEIQRNDREIRWLLDLRSILALGATVTPQVLCPTAETISACARSTLIGFRGELGDGNIAFICDQISRKSVLDCTPPAPGAADRAAVIEELARDVVKDYPIAAGTIVTMGGDGYGSIRALRIALSAPANTGETGS